MTEIIKRNFEPGRLLLVATLLMSLTLVSQLYVISESFDLSNGLQLSGLELSLTASYVFTAFSMVIVINEFFQVKTKMRGLLALTNLLAQREPQVTPVVASVPVQELSSLTSDMLDNVEPEEMELELDFEDEEDFDNLLDEELESVSDEAKDKYKTTKIRIEDSGEMEPLIEEGELKGIFDHLEEESEMERMLSESEVIKTLSELENIVDELKKRKVAPVQR